jgi:hypothetical protein
MQHVDIGCGRLKTLGSGTSLMICCLSRRQSDERVSVCAIRKGVECLLSGISIKRLQQGLHCIFRTWRRIRLAPTRGNQKGLHRLVVDREWLQKRLQSGVDDDGVGGAGHAVLVTAKGDGTAGGLVGGRRLGDIILVMPVMNI